LDRVVAEWTYCDHRRGENGAMVLVGIAGVVRVHDRGTQVLDRFGNGADDGDERERVEALVGHVGEANVLDPEAGAGTTRDYLLELGGIVPRSDTVGQEEDRDRFFVQDMPPDRAAESIRLVVRMRGDGQHPRLHVRFPSREPWAEPSCPDDVQASAFGRNPRTGSR